MQMQLQHDVHWSLISHASVSEHNSWTVGPRNAVIQVGMSAGDVEGRVATIIAVVVAEGGENRLNENYDRDLINYPPLRVQIQIEDPLLYYVYKSSSFADWFACVRICSHWCYLTFLAEMRTTESDKDLGDAFHLWGFIWHLVLKFSLLSKTNYSFKDRERSVNLRNAFKRKWVRSFIRLFILTFV